MIQVTLDDAEVRSVLTALQARMANLTPAMQDIGEALTESAKQRFASSTTPDGSAWAANSATTLALFGARYGSRSRTRRVSAKKPLIGESRQLGQSLHYVAGSDHVSIGSPMVYAAVQQFGAARHQFGRAPWGAIPARPFLPVDAAGNLTSADDQAAIVAILRGYLSP